MRSTGAAEGAVDQRALGRRLEPAQRRSPSLPAPHGSHRILSDPAPDTHGRPPVPEPVRPAEAEAPPKTSESCRAWSHLARAVAPPHGLTSALHASPEPRQSPQSAKAVSASGWARPPRHPPVLGGCCRRLTMLRRGATGVDRRGRSRLSRAVLLASATCLGWRRMARRRGWRLVGQGRARSARAGCHWAST